MGYGPIASEGLVQLHLDSHSCPNVGISFPFLYVPLYVPVRCSRTEGFCPVALGFPLLSYCGHLVYVPVRSAIRSYTFLYAADAQGYMWRAARTHPYHYIHDMRNRYGHIQTHLILQASAMVRYPSWDPAGLGSRYAPNIAMAVTMYVFVVSGTPQYTAVPRSTTVRRTMKCPSLCSQLQAQEHLSQKYMCKTY